MLPKTSADAKPEANEKKKSDQKVPHPHPLTVRPKELADRLGVTRRFVYSLMNHPDPNRRLPAPIKIGRATFWRIEDVQTWLARQGERSAA